MKLVLLPGLDGTGLLFAPLLEQLHSFIEPKIIAYPNRQRLSYGDHVAFVNERLPKEEDFFLLAESFSGRIAFEVAAKAPDNLRGVIFVSTFLQTSKTVPAWMANLLPFGPITRMGGPNWVMRKTLFGRDAPDRLLTEFWVSLRRVSPDVLRHRLRIVLGSHPCDGTLSQPTLHLIANQDRLVAHEVSIDLAGRCLQSNVHRIEGPHALLQSNPAACAKYIDHFCAQGLSAARSADFLYDDTSGLPA